MTWNYRVIRRDLGSGDNESIYYQINEVYYAEDGSIQCWTDEGIDPMGENLEELGEDLCHMQEALNCPVLEVYITQEGKEALKEIGGDANDT